MVVMGRVAAPFGVQGWIKVQPFTEAVDGLKKFPVWWVESGEAWREYPVTATAVHGRALTAKLAGCNDRDAAAALKGRQIAVPRDALPETAGDEYYWSDLVGLDVVNTRGEPLGRVREVLATGANDVLVVQGDRERLIPFIGQVVLRVDLKAGVMTVDWGADY
jgi:16S rRNA processing protein RimM